LFEAWKSWSFTLYCFAHNTVGGILFRSSRILSFTVTGLEYVLTWLKLWQGDSSATCRIINVGLLDVTVIELKITYTKKTGKVEIY